MEVLADAVTGSGRPDLVLVGPAGQSLVHHGAPGPADIGHAQDVAAEMMGAPGLIHHVEMNDAMGHFILRQLCTDTPFGHRSSACAVPDPAPMQIAGAGPESDPAEVRLLSDVDREPTPHLGPAPAARAPRAIAVPVRVLPLVGSAVDAER